MQSNASVVAHLLRVFGVSATTDTAQLTDVLVYDSVSEIGRAQALANAERGGVTILLRPSTFANLLGFSTKQVEADRDRALLFPLADDRAWRQVRSFHELYCFEGTLRPVLTDEEGRCVWGYLRYGAGHLFLIGSDLAADLTLLTQGDPAAADNRPTKALWGFNDERPAYLYEGLLDAANPFDRPADWFVWGLRQALIHHASVRAQPVLPFDAAGAVVVTGDDDQAPLADYEAQRLLLGDLPITYFLHPLTKQTEQTMAERACWGVVEWEIHPDALETPKEYDARLGEQVAWFSALTNRKPRLLRNHSFLNDGYWGHAASWIKQGIIASSNLPGVDGRVLNGSLLPKRLSLGGHLTDHWSVLTLFGDGAIFLNDWDEQTTFDAVMKWAQRIRDSGVPGLLVLNLHPANYLRAEPMHRAARAMVQSGFVAMTLGHAIDWFQQRDAGVNAPPAKGILAPGTIKAHAPAVFDAEPGPQRRAVRAWLSRTLAFLKARCS